MRPPCARGIGLRRAIMTDWYTTVQSPDCSASGCIRAGNDLIMPGTPGDLEDLRAALRSRG